VREVACLPQFSVNHVTLGRLLKGMRMMAEAAATRCKLSKQQEAILVDFIIEMANRNLGLQPNAVRDHTVQLLQSTNPGPTLRLGWAGRFISRHQDKLAGHWSRPFDHIRAMSATPEAMDKYFMQYKSIVGENGEKLSPDRQFAYNDSGILHSMGVQSCVVSC
jgi:hypothetical protein